MAQNTNSRNAPVFVDGDAAVFEKVMTYPDKTTGKPVRREGFTVAIGERGKQDFYFVDRFHGPQSNRQEIEPGSALQLVDGRDVKTSTMINGEEVPASLVNNGVHVSETTKDGKTYTNRSVRTLLVTHDYHEGKHNAYSLYDAANERYVKFFRSVGKVQLSATECAKMLRGEEVELTNGARLAVDNIEPFVSEATGKTHYTAHVAFVKEGQQQAPQKSSQKAAPASQKAAAPAPAAAKPSAVRPAAPAAAKPAGNAPAPQQQPPRQQGGQSAPGGSYRPGAPRQGGQQGGGRSFGR